MGALYSLKGYVRGKLTKFGLMPKIKECRFTKLLREFNINVVLDVGANNGQTGRHLLSAGYEGRIVSFEPLSQAFPKLKANASVFSQWTVVNMGLGDQDTELNINISGIGQSSSFREMGQLHIDAAPGSETVGTEKATVRKLDTILPDYCSKDDRCFLKVDTQGYENAVLSGSLNSLDQLIGIQLEMGVEEVYLGESTLLDTMPRMKELGYTLVSLSNIFSNKYTRQLLQVEGIWYRTDEIEKRAAAVQQQRQAA